MFRWLQERGMPSPTLVVWGYDDSIADLANGVRRWVIFPAPISTEVPSFH
jgi:hypothetical protein